MLFIIWSPSVSYCITDNLLLCILLENDAWICLIFLSTFPMYIIGPNGANQEFDIVIYMKLIYLFIIYLYLKS